MEKEKAKKLPPLKPAPTFEGGHTTRSGDASSGARRPARYKFGDPPSRAGDTGAKTSQPTTSRINSRDAVQAASKYLRWLTGYKGSIWVEEVELDKTGKTWLVTLAFLEPPAEEDRIKGILSYNPPKKVYKVFTVDAVAATVKSMKIREL